MGHAQTILGHLIPSDTVKVRGEKILVPLEGNEKLSAVLYGGSSGYMVSLFHGLSGSADADYMQRTALQYLREGHSVVLVNHRGAGDGRGLAERPYHSGRSEDVSSVIGYLRKRFPGKKQIAGGFSLSGNILLFLIGKRDQPHLPDAAIAVNAPINLFACAEALSETSNRLYDLRFVRKIIQEKNLSFSPWISLAELDALYTAPQSGFRDRDHYYGTCSAKSFLANIQTPTEVLAAADDPFIPVADYLNAAWSPAVNLEIQKQGGHLGYMTLKKNKLGNRRWLDVYMLESLQRLISKLEAKPLNQKSETHSTETKAEIPKRPASHQHRNR